MLGLSIVLLFCCSCKNTTQVERAFYYWKTDPYMLSEQEAKTITDQKIKKLYVKFFEVVPNEVFGSIPVSKSSFHLYLNYNADSLTKQAVDSLQIIPTVYIRNAVLTKATKGQLDTLADNIVFLVQKHYNEKSFHGSGDTLQEIQIDCDWTEKTKDNYFYLLKKIKTLSKKSISCTLRLYPYKYQTKMGVPPVDKVTLMCYNLISPLKEENKNSILDREELKLYLKGIDKYPLHLDIALPTFYWVQVYQNNQFVGLATPDSRYFFEFLAPTKPLWYEVTKDMEVGSFYLRPGDKVKVEEVDEQTLFQTIELLKEYVEFDEHTTVTLFHLDDKNIAKYSHETFTRFYTDFSK